MTYIIYSSQCTPCKYRNALRTLKLFTEANDYEMQIKNTAFSVSNKEEAKKIGQTLPFIYNADTGLTTKLVGVTYAELARIGRVS